MGIVWGLIYPVNDKNVSSVMLKAGLRKQAPRQKKPSKQLELPIKQAALSTFATEISEIAKCNLSPALKDKIITMYAQSGGR